MSIEPYQTREIARGKAILGILYPESPNFYLHEYAILNRARYAASLPCSECEVKDLLRCSSGQPIIQSVLVALWFSAADPSASRRRSQNNYSSRRSASGWRLREDSAW
jgi:hypothetical protein